VVSANAKACRELASGSARGLSFLLLFPAGRLLSLAEIAY
jgi:hypothetical protein